MLLEVNAVSLLTQFLSTLGTHYLLAPNKEEVKTGGIELCHKFHERNKDIN